jgi:ornithine cyclodeaminase/alanine dehydrogenase-like protein (mu-crystallin family)
VSPRVRVLGEAEIRAAIGPSDALPAVRAGLIALHRGEVEMPPGMTFLFSDGRDEAHVKGAHVRGDAVWTVKASTGFYGNAAYGLPASAGLSLTFSAITGRVDSVLLDNGYLTDLRTGAGGALAADLLAKPAIRHALIVGAGVQARFQLDALLGVRRPERITVYARRREQAETFRAELTQRHAVKIAVAEDLHAAVVDADLIVTTTPARAPLLQAAWIAPGTHVTAVGATPPASRSSTARSSRAPTSSPRTCRPSHCDTARPRMRSRPARSSRRRCSRSGRSLRGKRRPGRTRGRSRSPTSSAPAWPTRPSRARCSNASARRPPPRPPRTDPIRRRRR